MFSIELTDESISLEEIKKMKHVLKIKLKKKKKKNEIEFNKKDAKTRK